MLQHGLTQLHFHGALKTWILYRIHLDGFLGADQVVICEEAQGLHEEEVLRIGLQHWHSEVFLGYFPVLVYDIWQLDPLLRYDFELQTLGC